MEEAEARLRARRKQIVEAYWTYLAAIGSGPDETPPVVLGQEKVAAATLVLAEMAEDICLNLPEASI